MLYIFSICKASLNALPGAILDPVSSSRTGGVGDSSNNLLEIDVLVDILRL